VKQQEFEKLYSARLDDERKKAAVEIETAKASFEKNHSDRLAEIERREQAASDEFKKQEAVLKWARDSFQQEAAEREKSLKQKETEQDGRLIEKNRELEGQQVRIDLLQKQLAELPEAVRRRDEDLNRYKQAMESLESVIHTLESEKKSLRADSEHKLLRMNESLEAEKTRYHELEMEIPRRLKTAIEHERGRLAEKLSEAESGYREDLCKRQEEIEYLERNLKTFEENARTIQADRDAVSRKLEQLQTQYAVKQDEFIFREKQLQSEYDVRLKVELEKRSGALVSEIESARRIYEDNLRLKVEEIAHLRRELEASVNDSMAYQTQAAESRRAVDAAKARADSEIAALRTRLKSEYERRLAEEQAEIRGRHAGEKQSLAAGFEAQLKDLNLEVARKDEEIQRVRAELGRLKEEYRFAISEERQRVKNELQVQAASFSDTSRLYEDKIAQLGKALEAEKLEKEEVIQVERVRLERLFSEKEMDFDDGLRRKEQEISRLREEAAGLRGERERALSELAREKELESARARDFNERSTAREAEFQRKFEEALGRKNQELDSRRLAEEAREEAYRRSLEEFRGKLSEAMARVEAMKRDRG
jgi:chromosome segregation ATPase